MDFGFWTWRTCLRRLSFLQSGVLMSTLNCKKDSLLRQTLLVQNLSCIFGQFGFFWDTLYIALEFWVWTSWAKSSGFETWCLLWLTPNMGLKRSSQSILPSCLGDCPTRGPLLMEMIWKGEGRPSPSPPLTSNWNILRLFRLKTKDAMTNSSPLVIAPFSVAYSNYY